MLFCSKMHVVFREVFGIIRMILIRFFIDASLSSSHQKKVFEHEMRHIFENDFEKSNVQEIEKAAHK